MSDSLFRRLHQGPDLLILPNAWDAGSGRLFESLGAKAIATTSAGVAWSHGYPDGDALPVERLVATVSAIVRVIGVPLSVDLEGGYSSDPATVGETVAAVIDAGAVGINVEDGSGSPALLCAKIEQVKRAARQRGVELFVNARTDVYLRGLVPAEQALAETLARAQRYREAGCDGLFVPGLIAPDDIRTAAETVALPLNLLAWPGLASAAELQTMGVRRLSAGSGIAQALWGRARALAEAFLAHGGSEPLSEGSLPYARMNALLAGA